MMSEKFAIAKACDGDYETVDMTWFRRYFTIGQMIEYAEKIKSVQGDHNAWNNYINGGEKC